MVFQQDAVLERLVQAFDLSLHLHSAGQLTDFYRGGGVALALIPFVSYSTRKSYTKAVLMSLWRRIRPLLSATFRFFHISSIEAQNQHSGARLGLLWTPISALIFSAVLAIVFHHSDQTSTVDFFLYVFCGYIFWSFVSDSLTGSTNLIQSQLEFAVHNNLSILGLFSKKLVDRLFDYFINIIVLIFIIVIFVPSDFSWSIFLLPVFVVFVILTSLGASYLVNIITIFYPDMKTAVQVGVRFMFFASPVFWSAEASHGVRTMLVTYNPVAYYLSAGRQVFGLEALNSLDWLVISAVSVVVAGTGYVVFAASQNFVRNFK